MTKQTTKLEAKMIKEGNAVNDAIKFQKEWNEHVDALGRLKHTLPLSKWSKLDAVIAEAKEVVHLAAIQLSKR